MNLNNFVSEKGKMVLRYVSLVISRQQRFYTAAEKHLKSESQTFYSPFEKQMRLDWVSPQDDGWMCRSVLSQFSIYEILTAAS